MAAQNATFYCCKYYPLIFNQNYSGDCSGTWTVEIDSVSSPNVFGNYDNAFILSRTCGGPATNPCSGGRFTGNINMGCIPESLFPVTVWYTVKRNNITVFNLSSIFSNIGAISCSNCEQRCGVLP